MTDAAASASALSSRMNSLRAGVLGANDGIISTAGLVMGVAGASSDRGDVAAAGVAGLVAGAVSMALGEYVSVSTQRDSERAIIAKEIRDQAESPREEHHELVEVLEERGLSYDVAHEAVHELEAHDPLGAHLRIEYGITPDDLVNPWAAAAASAVSFSLGAALPLVAALLASDSRRAAITFVAVIVGLCLTGYVSARLSQSRPVRAVARLVAGGAVAMGVTYAIGQLLDTTVL